MRPPVETDAISPPTISGFDPWVRADAPVRPPIIVRMCDVEELMTIAFHGLASSPRLASGLLQEVERATRVSDKNQWSGSVVLGSRVLYRRGLIDAPRWITLVRPEAAAGPNGALSVLTTIGAGLLGLAKGQSILWDDRCGGTVRLEIINVIDPADEDERT